eukprot:13650773-Alexandrium_andersonii.AAC.1
MRPLHRLLRMVARRRSVATSGQLRRQRRRQQQALALVSAAPPQRCDSIGLALRIVAIIDM